MDQTDYYQSLYSAVARLEPNTAEARQAVYDLARHLLLEHARLDPPWELLEIVCEQRALEECIHEVEEEFRTAEDDWAHDEPPASSPTLSSQAQRTLPAALAEKRTRARLAPRWIWLAAALLVGLAVFALIALWIWLWPAGGERQAVQPPSAREIIERADERARAGDFDRAIAEYSSALRLDPANVTVLNNRAYGYWSKGETDLAIADYSEAIRLDPNNVMALSNRAVAYNFKGEFSRAIADLDKAVELRPADARVWNSRCWGRALAGKLQEALADCNESLRLQPDDVLALDSRGFTFLKMGRLDRAIADYDAALKLDAKLAGSLYGRGIAKLRRGEAEGGNSDVAAAKAIRPDIADTFEHYGVK
jgi:tetratricopeptide (TPR) repeat protein